MNHKLVSLMGLLSFVFCAQSMDLTFNAQALYDRLEQNGFRHFIDETCINTELEKSSPLQLDGVNEILHRALSTYYQYRFQCPDDQKNPLGNQTELLQIILHDYPYEFERSIVS